MVDAEESSSRTTQSDMGCCPPPIWVAYPVSRGTRFAAARSVVFAWRKVEVRERRVASLVEGNGEGGGEATRMVERERGWERPSWRMSVES